MDNNQRLTAQGGSWTLEESHCGVIVARAEVHTIGTDERGVESVQQTSTYQSTFTQIHPHKSDWVVPKYVI